MRLIHWLASLLVTVACATAQAGTLDYTTYYHNDHLGSPAAATDERGDVLWRAHYRPYGERQEAPKSANFGNLGYTGHAQDPDSQLVYAGARYYDPLIGRFLAVDPAPVASSAPGSFNRYLYANNNPYAYTDPDGELPFLVVVAIPAFATMMAHSDMANAPAVGETPQQLGTMDHLGALPGLNAGKAVTALKAAGEAKDAVKVASSAGRAGRQARLRELAGDDKLGSADRGWLQQEINSIERGQRSSIRNPPGKDLAHERGREAAKGYGYGNSNLQDRDLHKLQHKYDNFGRKNKERPLD